MNEDFRELLIFYRSYSPRTLTWVFNHLLWEFADHHFKVWFGIAKNYAQSKLKPILDELVIKPPRSIVLFSLRENRLEKCIFNTTISDILSCPYEKDSRIKDDEISVLPMRLAINEGHNEEKRAAERYLKKLRSFL